MGIERLMVTSCRGYAIVGAKSPALVASVRDTECMRLVGISVDGKVKAPRLEGVLSV